MAAPVLTADSSLVIPFMTAWHEAHALARSRLAQVRRLPAHVLAESVSVLSRLPGGGAVDAREALRQIVVAFPEEMPSLSGPEYLRVLTRLTDAGLGGGAVYDGLVGGTAAAARLVLLTRDRRAVPAYAAVGAEVELVG